MNQLSERELAAVLAALRYWQGHCPDDVEGDPTATKEASMMHFDECKPLNDKEIDELCERLDCNDTARYNMLCENLSAIAAEFHKSKLYQEFYDAVGDFVGIWRHMVEAAEAFTDEEIALAVAWDGGWIEAIDDYVGRLLQAKAQLPEEELRKLARLSIAEGFRLNERELHLDGRSNGLMLSRKD